MHVYHEFKHLRNQFNLYFDSPSLDHICYFLFNDDNIKREVIYEEIAAVTQQEKAIEYTANGHQIIWHLFFLKATVAKVGVQVYQSMQ